MKKLKILALALVIAMLVTAFASCGGSSFDNVFNDDYEFTAKPVKGVTGISDLEGFFYANDTANENFALFFKDGPSATRTYKVYSFAYKRVVGVFTKTSTYGYEIQLCSNIPAFVVKSTDTEIEDSSEGSVTSTALYDQNGNIVVSVNEAVDTKEIGNMYIFNYAVYIDNGEGGIQKKMDLPEYLMIEKINYANDDYLYYLNDDRKQVVIYDTEFTPLSTWTAPSYADINEGFFVLNNGDVFVQYVKKLISDAQEFDYYDYDDDGNVCKYDLVTLIIDADSGIATEVPDFNYEIVNISTSTELHNDNRRDNYYGDDFENIATVKPISDRVINSSIHARDVILMDNDGMVEGSLKLVDGQISFTPVLIDDGVYGVETVFGVAIIDGDGSVIQHINNTNVSIEGRYIVTDRAIYDSSMNEIYDLKKNKAEVVGAIDYTIFVKVKSGRTDAIIALNGEKANIVVSSTDSQEFAIKSDIGGYEIYDKSTYKYSYYTADGQLIRTFDAAVNTVCGSHKNDAIIGYYRTDTDNVYVLFIK